jgi:hypothetical protein
MAVNKLLAGMRAQEIAGMISEMSLPCNVKEGKSLSPIRMRAV